MCLKLSKLRLGWEFNPLLGHLFSLPRTAIELCKLFAPFWWTIVDYANSSISCLWCFISLTAASYPSVRDMKQYEYYTLQFIARPGYEGYGNMKAYVDMIRFPDACAAW